MLSLREIHYFETAIEKMISNLIFLIEFTVAFITSNFSPPKKIKLSKLYVESINCMKNFFSFRILPSVAG